MKHRGYVGMDDLGRIVIPKPIRAELGWGHTTPLVIWEHNRTVVIEEWYGCCVFCYSSEDLEDWLGRRVCRSCRDQIAARIQAGSRA